MLPESAPKKKQPTKPSRKIGATDEPAATDPATALQIQLMEAKFATSFIAAVSSSLYIDDICSLAARVIFDSVPFQRIVFSVSTESTGKSITYSPSAKKGSTAPLERIAAEKGPARHPSSVNTEITLPNTLGTIEIQFKKGHGDFLTDSIKSIIATHFSQAVLNAVELSKMRDLAMRDGLTGLLNRRIFDELLSHKIEQQGSHPVSLLLIDLDNFKQVNDTYGHQAGDEVLVSFAQLLKESCRGSDLVARFGGEEFAVILPETPDTTAHAVAQRLRKRLANTIFTFDGQRLRITVSIGLATSLSENPILTANVIKRADSALYQAKQTGKNRVCTHSTDLLPDQALPGRGVNFEVNSPASC